MAAAPRPLPKQKPKAEPEPEPEPEPMPEFEDITLENAPAAISEAIARAGWAGFMPVQAKALPWVLAKKDVMVQARTGSGKTGAFVLPLLELLDPTRDTCQALVLVPTRELARQVEEEARTLFGDCGLRTVAVYGGVGYGPQRDAFRKGAHLVVGTPGRILDHLMQRNLILDDLRVLVFDEADRMLSIGFYPDMKQVQRYLPERYAAFMFSATFPPNVLRLSNEFLYKPGLLSLSGDSVHVAEVAHVFYEVPAMGKERCLIRIIETENPANGIIFCNTKADVHFVTAVLQQFGYNADELSADLSQARREQVLQRVREGSLRFLVATDVAARGIDIPELSHVFLYEPPEDHESYIHRAGRTGRAGAAGVAISLVDIIQKLQLQRIGTQYKIEFERRDLPTDEDVQAVVGTRITALLETQLRARNVLEKERMRRYEPLAKSLAENEELAGLVAMLLDDIYQATLHAAAPCPALPSEPARRDDGEGYKGKRRGRYNRGS
ncbi:MAG: DEAD/DEAH box helicase [Desulfovibrionaceae bacterium]